MNTKTIVIEWEAREVYPNYRLEDLTDNPDLGLILAEFTSKDIGEIPRSGLLPVYSARVSISKGIYGERRLRLVAIDADGESGGGEAFVVELNREKPTAPFNVRISS